MFRRKNDKKRRPRRRWRKSNPRKALAVQRKKIIADSQFVVLPFVHRFTLDASIAATATEIIRGNSCYDPLSSVGTRQPLGFDQWMSFYNHFCVYKTTIELEAINTGESASAACNLTVAIRDDATTITDISEIIDANRSVTKMVPVSGGGGPVKIRYGYNWSKFFGMPVTKDHDYRGTKAADCAEQAHIHITQSGLTSGTDCGLLYVTARVKYYCKLTEMADLTASAQ